MDFWIYGISVAREREMIGKCKWFGMREMDGEGVDGGRERKDADGRRWRCSSGSNCRVGGDSPETHRGKIE